MFEWFYYSVPIEKLVAWTFNLLVVLAVLHGIEYAIRIFKYLGWIESE